MKLEQTEAFISTPITHRYSAAITKKHVTANTTLNSRKTWNCCYYCKLNGIILRCK